MITGETKSGFVYNVEDDAFDDYELLETICKVDNGNTSLIPKMLEDFLGKEQTDALKEHIRGQNGKVSAKKMSDEIAEIFSACKQGKLLILAHMINIDEDALMCDLAETYHIYNYRSLPCKMVATFSCGLRNSSRIKMKMAGTSITASRCFFRRLLITQN